jgi:predicted nucleotidyltransferase
MISDDSFKLIIDIITSQSGVRKIMLFGSYAREEMHADSDLDILVIVDDTIPDIRELKNMLYRTISAGIGKPCDILVEHEHTFRLCFRSVLKCYPAAGNGNGGLWNTSR